MSDGVLWEMHLVVDKLKAARTSNEMPYQMREHRIPSNPSIRKARAQEPEVQINNNFNSLFINSNNNENIESDNNSSLIPSVAEIDLTDIDNSDNNNSSYSTSNS